MKMEFAISAGSHNMLILMKYDHLNMNLEIFMKIMRKNPAMMRKLMA